MNRYAGNSISYGRIHDFVLLCKLISRGKAIFVWLLLWIFDPERNWLIKIEWSFVSSGGLKLWLQVNRIS